MDKKGQVEQVLTHILFILIAGFLIIMGYQFITGLQSDSCTAEKVTFVPTIEGFFNQNDGYRSVKKESVKLPCNYQQICFVDRDVWNDSAHSVTSTGYFPGAANTDKRDVIQTAEDVQKNIFLIGQFAEPIGYSDKIIVEDPDKILCAEALGSTVNLVFKGQGDGTVVEVE